MRQGRTGPNRIALRRLKKRLGLLRKDPDNWEQDTVPLSPDPDNFFPPDPETPREE